MISTMKRYDDNDLQRFGQIIAEQISSEFKTGFEAIEVMSRQVKRIPVIEQDIAELKSDMKAIRVAVTATNKDQHKLERRISRLESIAHRHA
jgi:hypothetical protein